MLKVTIITQNAVLVNYDKNSNIDKDIIGDLILKDFVIDNCVDNAGFVFLVGDVDKILNFVNN